MSDFEKELHAMFDDIWDCEIDHPVYQDTVGELMEAVIQAYEKHKPTLSTNLAEVGTDLISRQAAIDAISEALATGKQPIKALEQLPPIQPEPHWIPVTEDTLPEENRVVVVCGDKGTWDFGTYRGHGDNIHFWHWKKNTYKRVYWWMYKEDALPEPYKGVTE